MVDDLSKYVLKEAPAGTRGCLMCCLTPDICDMGMLGVSCCACTQVAIDSGVLTEDWNETQEGREFFSRMYLAPADVPDDATFWRDKRVEIATAVLCSFVQSRPTKRKDLPDYFAEVVSTSVRMAGELIKELKR